MANLESILEFGYKSNMLYNKMSRSILEKYDLTPCERDILLFLYTNRIDTSIEIAKCLMISKSLISKAIGSLIARGFIEGDRDEKDMRCIHLSIVPHIQPMIDELYHAWCRYFSVITSNVSEEELNSLANTVYKMNKNADIYINNKNFLED